MEYEIAIPREASSEYPKGTLLLKTRSDFALVGRNHGAGLADTCAHAARVKNVVHLPGETVFVGRYSDIHGWLQILPEQKQALEDWLGRSITRQDLSSAQPRPTDNLLLQLIRAWRKRSRRKAR